MAYKILILAANPQDTTRLRLDKEVREIRSVIQSSPLRDQISLEDRGAVRPEDFQEELLRVKPQILHFCGHGSRQGLIAEDGQGVATTVPSQALVSLLRIWSERPSGAPKVECMILNSCYTEDIAMALSRHVEYVIGMYQEISDEAAIAFAKAIYGALGADETIETAFKLGCNILELKGIPEDRTPVLIQDGRIVAEGPEKRPGPSRFGFDSPRLQVLWRLAYAFLRLDQLPTGGWGKGLYSWMEALWKGDRGTIDRTVDTRTKGGTDLTTYTFYYYYLFLSKILPPAQVARLLEKNETAHRVYKDFQEKRIDYRGGVGLRTRDGEVPDVRVRHTLMGFITLLLYGKASGFDIGDSLDITHSYLVGNIPEWQHSKAHLFAMTGAAVKLQEMLAQDVARRQLSAEQIKALQARLAAYIPQMMGATNKPLRYSPRPPGTIQGPLVASMFRPYKDFWRMERSNFVMYFPFFVTDDGLAFLPGVSEGIRSRCARIFGVLLQDIALPYDGSAPCKHLIRYHRSSDEAEASRDWGLSAELAVLLQMDAVRELLIRSQQVSAESYDQKRSALNRALVDTFDAYYRQDDDYRYRDLFEFTHGPSFGRILHLFEKEQIEPAELERLDEAISRLCAEGVTEAGLAALIKRHIDPAAATTGVDQRAMRDLMITKLESGEHTPDGVICAKTKWQQKVLDVVNKSTIAFYEGTLGDKHIERYAEDPRRSLIYEIQDIFKRRPPAERIALDVGCGAGQYAELLAQMGFKVELLDASTKMLELACARMGLAPNVFTPVNIFDASWGYSDGSFDLIFASAIMIHVPQDKRRHVYSTFRRLLKRDGLLFVSYKIGDHTLISEDGRFFAYYRDQAVAQQELEDHGFRIEGITININNKDMYLVPKLIQWANFYCFKR